MTLIHRELLLSPDQAYGYAPIDGPVRGTASGIRRSGQYKLESGASAIAIGNGAVITYTYNNLNEVLPEVTKTSGGSTIASDRYTYYPNGTVWTKADSDGSTTTFTYDGADQLRARRAPARALIRLPTRTITIRTG